MSGSEEDEVYTHDESVELEDDDLQTHEELAGLEKDDARTNEELVRLEIECLHQNWSQDTEKIARRPYKRRPGKKPQSTICPPVDKTYALSFSKFLEKQNPTATDNDSLHTVAEEPSQEQALQNELLSLESEGTSSKSLVNVRKRPRQRPRINTKGNKQHLSNENQENESPIRKKTYHASSNVAGNNVNNEEPLSDVDEHQIQLQKDKYNDMTDRDLLLETVKVTKSIYRKQYRQEVLEKQILSRLEKVEDICRVYYDDEVVTWPVIRRETLDYIEQKLDNDDQAMNRMIKKQFSRVTSPSLYKFVHDNLVGLLSHVGRWTWTGQTSNALKGQGPPSEKASDLKSVRLLVGLATSKFPNQDVEQMIKLAFTNINSSIKKQKQRQGAQHAHEPPTDA